MKDFFIGLAVGMVGGVMLACCPNVQDFANDAKNLVKKDVIDPVARCVSRSKRKVEKAIKDMENAMEDMNEND